MILLSCVPPVFQTLLDQENPDIDVGTESWLDSNISASFSSIFPVFRKDRASDSHEGVFITVKNTFIANKEKDINANCEMVCIRVRGIKPTYIGSFDRPEFYYGKWLRLSTVDLAWLSGRATHERKIV